MKIPFLRKGGIERFAWFEPWLARGGQPSEDDLIDLRAQGVRTVVNLRERDEASDVERLHLQSIHIPVVNDEAPTKQQALEWLTLCERLCSTAPLFVHCKGGEGRTSLFCALVRVAQGCTVENAIEEQRTFDFQPEGKHHAQAEFLRSFARHISAGEIVVPELTRSAYIKEIGTRRMPG
jgi:protein tyrosine phosphatase (PTP) superfamily phosphohydrolase (DUF442 family)